MASVRIENDAWSDGRYALLAELCEMPDADVALIRCARLWSHCTDKNTDVLPAALIDAIAKHKGFAKKMVSAELAEKVAEGYRIKGTKGRIEWLESKRKNGAKGGYTKASNKLASASPQLQQKPSGGTTAGENPPSESLPSYSYSYSSEEERELRAREAELGDVRFFEHVADAIGAEAGLGLTDKARTILRSALPKIRAAAEKRGLSAGTLMHLAYERFKAHPSTTSARCGKPWVFVPQWETWLDDAPARGSAPPTSDAQLAIERDAGGTF